MSNEATHPTTGTDHAGTESHAPAHDQAAEVAHAWKDLKRDIYFFVGFFSLIILAVIEFEFTDGHNMYWILGLGLARFTLIAVFLYALTKPFSLIVRTFAFTIFFLGGMVQLSIWSSYLPTMFANPISLPAKYQTNLTNRH